MSNERKDIYWQGKIYQGVPDGESRYNYPSQDCPQPHSFVNGQQVIEGEDYEVQFQRYKTGSMCGWVHCLSTEYTQQQPHNKRIIAVPLAASQQLQQEGGKEVFEKVSVNERLPEDKSKTYFVIYGNNVCGVLHPDNFKKWNTTHWLSPITIPAGYSEDEVETMCVGFGEWIVDEKFIWNNSVRKWSRQPNMYLFLSSSDLFKLYQQHLQSLK